MTESNPSRSLKTTLITGITGFVGSHLAEYLLNETDVSEVCGLLRWRSPKDNIQSISRKIELCYGDLSDKVSLDAILRERKPDVIFHLGAQSYVDFSFVSPISTLEANIIGTCNLLESIKNLKQQEGYDPIVHICSSSEVYGQVSKEDIPIREETPLKPASPYAVSKVGEDLLAYQYWLSWGIKTIRARMFTHTGPRRGEIFVVSNFAQQIAAIEAGVESPTIRVGNLDSVRTFCDVRDAVRAYWLLVNMCRPGEVYNIGGKTTMTIHDMLEKLLSYSQVKKIAVEIDPKRLRPSDVTLQVPNTEKFTKITGWEPEISFEQTLQDILNYWREHFDRLKPIAKENIRSKKVSK